MALGMGRVTLQNDQGSTILEYDYQAQVSGKLAAIGSRLLEGAIRLVLDQLFKGLAKEAGAQADSWISRIIERIKIVIGVHK